MSQNKPENKFSTYDPTESSETLDFTMEEIIPLISNLMKKIGELESEIKEIQMVTKDEFKEVVDEKIGIEDILRVKEDFGKSIEANESQHSEIVLNLRERDLAQGNLNSAMLTAIEDLSGAIKIITQKLDSEDVTNLDTDYYEEVKNKVRC
jgi:hypothetical protein